MFLWTGWGIFAWNKQNSPSQDDTSTGYDEQFFFKSHDILSIVKYYVWVIVRTYGIFVFHMKI